jgi:hypothetical protein
LRLSQQAGNGGVLKAAAMKTHNRDLLVLLKNEFATQQSIEHEVECLNHILVQAESLEKFFTAHELAERYSITSKPARLLKAIRTQFKPFVFLLNKN